MKRGFRGAPRPLLPAMLLVATTNPNAGQEHHDVAQSQPSSSTLLVPSTSSQLVQSPPTIPASIPASTPTPIPASIPTPTPIPKTEPEPFEHTFDEPSPAHQHFSPPQEQAQGQMTMDDLLQLDKKVKKLEGFLKRRNVVLSYSEEEETEAQGRKSQSQDDPLVSLVQGLITPSKTIINALGEEQVEDISPNTLEAAKTLSRVASLKPKSIDKGRRYKRRKETKGKKVVTSLDFQEEVDTGAKGVNTAEGVNTGGIKVSTVSEQVSTGSTKRSIPSPDKGQRAGKAPMIIEEAPKKPMEQILQVEASLAEAIRLDTLQKEEVAKQGTWKLSQLKNLSFEEVKEEFDKLVKQVESFAPINFEATKASLKRFGEELQTKTTKRLKDEDVKDVEPTKKYGMDGPEDELEKVFWKYLKNMFEEPLSTDPIWSLLSQQKIISWRYYDSCRVHCLNLESMDIYMLIERKYPLSAEICKTMLDKKLQGGKPDEDCYKMLKMMEKQAGIRK
ncbi:hypothetical protein Tco_0280850 [Tanacetum coccineum]